MPEICSFFLIKSYFFKAAAMSGATNIMLIILYFMLIHQTLDFDEMYYKFYNLILLLDPMILCIMQVAFYYITCL
jgi:hypothetical protein